LWEEPSFPDEIEGEEVNLPYIAKINNNEMVLKKCRENNIVPDDFQIDSLLNFRIGNRDPNRDSVENTLNN
jgi:hypothetical protein